MHACTTVHLPIHRHMDTHDSRYPNTHMRVQLKCLNLIVTLKPRGISLNIMSKYFIVSNIIEKEESCSYVTNLLEKQQWNTVQSQYCTV